jgi:hypothetical protein
VLNAQGGGGNSRLSSEELQWFQPAGQTVSGSAPRNCGIDVPGPTTAETPQDLTSLPDARQAVRVPTGDPGSGLRAPQPG